MSPTRRTSSSKSCRKLRAKRFFQCAVFIKSAESIQHIAGAVLRRHEPCDPLLHVNIIAAARIRIGVQAVQASSDYDSLEQIGVGCAIRKSQLKSSRSRTRTM